MEQEIATQVVTSVDYALIFTIIGTGLAFWGILYGTLRNFKMDVNKHIDDLTNRQNILDERMFQLSTGKTLREAIMEEKMKKKENQE